jgi:hypothetical protein
MDVRIVGNRFRDRDVDGTCRCPFAQFWIPRCRARNFELHRVISGHAAADAAIRGLLRVLEAALEAEGHALRHVAGRPNASILISVDQAEEMGRADGKSGEALADYLRAALGTTSSPWQLAFTIRTDSFPELQSHRRFQNLEARGYDLRALPVFRFDSVVEEQRTRKPCGVGEWGLHRGGVNFRAAESNDHAPIIGKARRAAGGAQK